MAEFDFTFPTGAPDDEQDYLMLSVVAKMPIEEKIKICMAGANILITRLQEFLGNNTHDANAAIRGALAKSLKAKPIHDSVFVQPVGKHHGKAAKAKTRADGYHRAKKGQGKGRSNKSSHHGLSSGTSAQEVGYYLEYGTPRMPALHWMETVAKQSEAEVQDAMESALDEYLEKMEFS